MTLSVFIFECQDDSHINKEMRAGGAAESGVNLHPGRRVLAETGANLRGRRILWGVSRVSPVLAEFGAETGVNLRPGRRVLAETGVNLRVMWRPRGAVAVGVPRPGRTRVIGCEWFAEP